MGTSIDNSTAGANARGPGGALVRRTTVRVSVPRTLLGPLRWRRRLDRVRREARRRLLANDPQTTTIRRTVGWSSLAGAIFGVVLAFVASEPEDSGRGIPRRGPQPSPAALAHRPAARQPSPRRPLPATSGQTQASAPPSLPLPPPGAARPEDVRRAPPAPAPEPAVAGTPPSIESPPPLSPPAAAAPAPAPSSGDAPEVPVVASVTSLATPPPRPSVSKGRRREGPGTPAPLARADGTGASGSHGAEADELVWLAERAFQAGHAAEAIRLGQKALAAGAGARAQLTIAGAYFDMREFDRARSAYEAVLAEDPGNQAARTGLDISRSALARSLARAP